MASGGEMIRLSASAPPGDPSPDEHTEQRHTGPGEHPTYEALIAARWRWARARMASGQRLTLCRRTGAHLGRRLCTDRSARWRGRTGENVVDRGEELTGHLLGHAGQHPLADPADHPADDGIGVVVHPGLPVALLGETDLHIGGHGAGCPRTGRSQHEGLRLLLIAEHHIAVVRALRSEDRRV